MNTALVTLSSSKGERASRPLEPLQAHNRRSPFDELRVTATAGAVVTLAGAVAALVLAQAGPW